MRYGGSIAKEDQAEYARLLVRQLRCHKVDLALSVVAWASVLLVAKSTSAQREVWNGANLYSAAATPPSPPHLANPTALVDLEALDGARIRVSKRDAKCYFDQLTLPPHMRKWFGRPSLKLGDILKCTDMTKAELVSHLPSGARVADNLVLWPVCTSWPMGFAWSSFIAQSKLLQCCTNAGLTTNLMLADDLPTPAHLSAVFALATDDVMLFTLGAPDVAVRWLHALDKSIADAGIQAHAKKAVTAALDETVVGIDVVDGCFLAPHAPKLARMFFSGCLHFLRERKASQLA